VIRPSVAALATALLVAGGLAPAPAYADSFTDADFYSGGSGGASGGEPCSNVVDYTQMPLRPLVANEPPVTGTSKTAGTLVLNSDFSDVIHYDSTMTSTARFVAGPGQPATLSLQGAGSVAVTTDKPVSECRVHSEAMMEVDFELTVTAPSLVDARVRTTGSGGRGSLQVFADGDPDGSSLRLESAAAGTSTGRLLLLPGQYAGYLGVYSEYTGSVAASGASTLDVEAVLRLLGERIGKVEGKGAKYVTLPGGRTCSDGKVPVSITTKRKRVEDIRKVEFFVGDKRVKRVSEPKKGKAVTLRAPLGEDVSVRAVVTLDNGKVKDVRADYVACSA
jgi:hypothetical protein